MTLPDAELTYDPKHPFDGAFTCLQNVFQKTNINEGIVNIRVSSNENNMEYPVVKRDEGFDWWVSDDVNGSWYEVNFIHSYFHLKSYVIRDWSLDFFANWKVLGSNDGVNYDVVDSVNGFQVSDVNSHPNFHFVCKYPKTRKYFRIQTSGKRLKETDYTFAIYRLEFYGIFTLNDHLMITFMRKTFLNNLLLIFIIIIILYDIK